MRQIVLMQKSGKFQACESHKNLIISNDKDNNSKLYDLIRNN